MVEHEPQIQEDAKNLSVVTVSAILAGLITIALVANVATPEPEQSVLRQTQPVVMEIAEPIVVEPGRAPLTGINRLYGTVTTVHGRQLTGYIRRDRNEGSWTDLLDATKPRYRGGSSLSGIRFGHVDRIDVTGRKSALFTLRNGQQMELTANASDLGTGLRGLLVDEGNGLIAEFSWRDLESIDFEAPGAVRPSEVRMFGTVTARDGLDFTGYVTWDVDEIYSTDILDGDVDGRRLQIPFGDIETIERYSSWSSRVTLNSGETVILEGTNDVDLSISGIEVSDATLGAVKLDWDDFDEVRFFEAEDDVAAARFDGGAPLSGTVYTVDGDAYEGEIIWDADEMYTWEMLNGDIGDIEFHIEFGNIERIEKTSRGAAVTLRDGRTFDLSGSNDVDRGNRGLLIRTDGREFEIDWRRFREAEFSR